MLFDKFTADLDCFSPPIFLARILSDKNPVSGAQKRRKIESPNESMRIIHDRFLRYLRRLPLKYSYATGCLPGNSPLKNVQRHRLHRYFYLIDLKNAYSRVEINRLAEILCKTDPFLNNQESAVRLFLETYCISQSGGLVVGGPASPDLFNLYCLYLIDNVLEESLRGCGLIYSRYLDDLVFSGNEPISRADRKQIRYVIENAGFAINHRKSKVVDLKKGPISMNGIGLEFKGRVFLPRHFSRRLSGLIHHGLAGNLELRSKIEGAMSVFWAVAERKNLNRTEKKIVRKYREFLKFCQLFHV